MEALVRARQEEVEAKFREVGVGQWSELHKVGSIV